jgi:hypothetical protein
MYDIGESDPLVREAWPVGPQGARGTSGVYTVGQKSAETRRSEPVEETGSP